MNAIAYCKVLEENFVPFWQELPSSCVFMEDGAPIHTAKYNKAWRQNKGIESIKWPAQSPDLNPIENIWQQLKTAVEKRGPKNKEQLLIVLQEEWEKLRDKKSLRTLVKSMRRRVRAVIEANGMPTKY